MTTDKTPATLATAKHGGCVQLGDEFGPREVWVNVYSTGEFREANNTRERVGADGVGTVLRYVREDLSAQPSPGGQGDALAQFEEWAQSKGMNTSHWGDGKYMSRYVQEKWEIWQAAVAARQPVAATVKDSLTVGGGQAVGEPVADWSKRGGKPTDWRNELLTLAEHHGPIPAFARSAMRVIARSMPVPPAQAVDLPYSIDADPAGIRARVADCITGTLMVGAQGHTPPPAGHWVEPFWQAARADATALLVEERAHGETIDQRDRYHEVADDLAGHIAAITGVDIGEHSSANFPWQNAIEVAEEYKPAQAVDLGQFRSLARNWIIGYGGTAGEARRACADELLSLIDSQAVGQSFQAGVAEWMGQCFLPSLCSNMTERGDRLLEEVLELLQAHGYDKARIPTLVDYVFGRPVGEPAQEVGGVMVTLAGYCWVAGLDMHAAGDAELARINQPEVMDKIRRKQEAKNALHFDTPLPGHAAPTAQTVDLGAERMFYIQDTRQFVGNCPMWWGPNGSGYVTRLDEAGRYTEQEAIKQNRTRDTDIPWPCAEIDAIARRTVDGQHMRPRAERLAELALLDSQAVGNG